MYFTDSAKALLFTPFAVTFANPFKIHFVNGICSLLNHFLTDFAVNAKSCVNSNGKASNLTRNLLLLDGKYGSMKKD